MTHCDAVWKVALKQPLGLYIDDKLFCRLNNTERPELTEEKNILKFQRRRKVTAK
jgi:hypothetical protein